MAIICLNIFEDLGFTILLFVILCSSIILKVSDCCSLLLLLNVTPLLVTEMCLIFTVWYWMYTRSTSPLEQLLLNSEVFLYSEVQIIIC